MSEPTITTEIDDLPKAGQWRGPKAIAALRHRDFAIYWVGLTVSNIGSWMQIAAQGWLVYALTGSKIYLGLVVAVGSIPMLIFTLPSGVMADRFSKRKIVILTQTLAMILAAVYATLIFTNIIRPWHILVLAACSGLVNSLDMPARQAMAVELVGKDDLLNAVALTSTGFNAARVIGPAAAGVIMHYGGVGTCFLVNSISFLAIIVGLVMIRPTPVRVSFNGRSVLSGIMEGLRYARRDVLIRDILLLTGLLSTFGFQYGTIMPVFAKNVLKVGERGYGLLLSAAGVGALFGALAVAAIGHRHRHGRVMAFGSILAPLGLMAFSLSPLYLLSLACLVVAGFGIMLFFAVSNSIIQTASPDDLRGRLMSLRSFVFMGMAPVGALQIGWVAQVAGARVALLAGGTVCLLAGFWFTTRSKAFRNAE